LTYAMGTRTYILTSGSSNKVTKLSETKKKTPLPNTII